MSLIDEIKQRNEIIQVVSDYVDLDTSRTPKGLCPFHAERTPSFVVYPDTGTWRCFGACAEGGDVISFLMKRESLSFKEALRSLAERAGIPYEERSRESAPRQLDSLYDANQVAANYFRSLLLAPGGERARGYLKERGIGSDVIERRGFGLAPDGARITLGGHLRTQGVTARAARDAGLVTRTTDGGWRDMLAGRLTIEIRDRRGRVVGFGGRSLDGSEPKYLNTPRTEIFDKSALLYGLDWAADSIRDAGEAIVVEGYMDVVAAHEHGFTNVVASMGTAVTGEQLKTLAQLVGARSDQGGAVVLCLDADAAGDEATFNRLRESASEILQFGRLRVKIARPVGGKDPDEAIRSGPDQWKESLKDAEPLVDYLISACAARFDVTTGEGKRRVADAVKPLIFSMSNPYDQDRYWSKLAGALEVSPERLRMMEEPPRRRARRRPDEQRQEFRAEQVEELLGSNDDIVEEHLLAMLFQFDGLREHALAMPDNYFRDSGNRALFTVWRESSTLAELSSSLDESLAEKFERLASRPLPPADHLQRVEDVNRCVQRLHERLLRNLKLLEAEALQDLTPEEREALLSHSLDPNESLKKVFTGRA